MRRTTYPFVLLHSLGNLGQTLVIQPMHHSKTPNQIAGLQACLFSRAPGLYAVDSREGCPVCGGIRNAIICR